MKVSENSLGDFDLPINSPLIISIISLQLMQINKEKLINLP